MKAGKLLRSAGVVGGFTLLSRGLGMARDMIMAYHFGTSPLASAFFVAFTIPNLFRRLFGEGALSAAFIPIFVETRAKEGDQSAWEMAAKVVTMTLAALSTIAILGVILLSGASKLPCFSDFSRTTLELARIMFPYVVFICMAGLFMGVLNSFKHFATPAFAPCLLNLILIAVMLFVFPMLGDAPENRVLALSFAVLIAGTAQVVVQLPALKRCGCPFKFSSRWNDPRVRRMLLLMAPAALGMAVTQFNVLIDRLLAMWIGPWAPAALFYSERMIYFPLGIIATAMGTVLLPTFSSHAALNDRDAMSASVGDALRHLAFIMTPATLGLLVLAPNIISALFENGAFNADSTRLCARALMFYAPGLIVFSAAKVFVPAFYAMQDTKTPVRIGIYVVLANLALNIALILTLPEYWKHAGMAFSTVAAETAGMITLGVLLAKRVRGIEWKSTATAFARNLACALLMGGAVWWIAAAASEALLPLLPAKIADFATLALAVSGGAGIYFLLALLFRAPELREIRAALRGE